MILEGLSLYPSVPSRAVLLHMRQFTHHKPPRELFELAFISRLTSQAR